MTDAHASFAAQLIEVPGGRAHHVTKFSMSKETVARNSLGQANRNRWQAQRPGDISAQLITKSKRTNGQHQKVIIRKKRSLFVNPKCMEGPRVSATRPRPQKPLRSYQRTVQCIHAVLPVAEQINPIKVEVRRDPGRTVENQTGGERNASSTHPAFQLDKHRPLDRDLHHCDRCQSRL